MSHLYPFCNDINLHVEKHISLEDAQRQEMTAREILRRLKTQPGLILADEVGMGKTFVALAVAVSVALENRHRRPVVIMVPPSLREKWPADFKLFRDRCLPKELAERLTAGEAHRAEDFLKLLDDPPSRRRSIIFATHGCMSRGLADKWVKLALIRQALWHRHGIGDLRSGLCKILGRLLRLSWVDHQHGQEIWEELLDKHPLEWLGVLQKWEIDPEEDDNPETDDDPVPRAVCEVLRQLPTDRLFEALQSIPMRQTDSFDARLHTARQAITQELKSLWSECIESLKLRLPLLILDEAHHLKNADTHLASLFRCQEAKDDVEEVTRGVLSGVFERMLFLTATPFQLGHGELCSVLDRFGGIAWNSRLAPKCGHEGFQKDLGSLRSALDVAQESAIKLDTAWGQLRDEDVALNGQAPDVETWWKQAAEGGQSPAASLAINCYREANTRLKAAEVLLRPWVIRHLKSRFLPKSQVPRRQRLPGRAICDDAATDGRGIAVGGTSLLPFLLAARASCCAPESRPVFAEGLASSYEAFLYTRRQGNGSTAAIDEDDDVNDEPGSPSVATKWYLDQLERLLPKDDVESSTAHPKVLATVNRTVSAWKAGEKVLVFCHFIATGKILRQCISRAIDFEIKRMGADKLKCSPDRAAEELERIGDRFFDADSPIRKASDAEIAKLIDSYPKLTEHRQELLELIRRNIRTPSFLVRFFPLEQKKLGPEVMLEALDKADTSSQMTLRRLIHDFLEFLAERCDEDGRQRFIHAVNRVQTGSHVGKDVQKSYSVDELQGSSAEMLIPNVRLVNGTAKPDTRQRLMLAFNTPFYPEILVASSVMAEGVDLQMNCRTIIHHDLCWNPSMLEQRTGRIDRVGAKAERCGKSIQVYLPYIGETQDEKMYRVVIDRERWFSVVMGEKFSVDAKTTEKLASRVPFPESAAAGLAFRLEVKPPSGSLPAPN